MTTTYLIEKKRNDNILEKRDTYVATSRLIERISWISAHFIYNRKGAKEKILWFNVS